MRVIRKLDKEFLIYFYLIYYKYMVYVSNK